MRKTFALITVGWCLGTLPPPPAASAADGHAPRLVCDQPVFNFGERNSDGEVVHTFVLRNTGDLSLLINSLRPTCGCTVGKLGETIVRPGASTTVTVTFNLRGREGPQNKLLYVLSNDPAQREFALTLAGTIVKPVSVEPGILFFGRLASSAAATGTVVVTANDGVPLRITQAQVSAPCLTAEVEPSTNARSQQVVVRVAPPLPEGLTRATLTLQTTHPRQPRIEVTVSFLVPGAFTVIPPEIFLAGRLNESLPCAVEVRSVNNTPFKILAIEPPRSNITVRCTALSKAAYRVELERLEVLPELDGQHLRVTTDQTNRPEILIPLRVFVR